MHRLSTAAILLSLAVVGTTAIAASDAAAPPALSAAEPAKSSTPGAYVLDPAHASVIVRIGHGGGISYSTFRFNKVGGTLDWNAARPEDSRVAVDVDPASITSVVPTFGQELSGERFLNVAKFPGSRFVSRSIRRTGPDSGVISGDLTLLGVTRAVNVDARLTGAGKDFRGTPVIGFSGTTRFNRSDFGLNTMMGPIGNEVQLVLDLEFRLSPAQP